MTAANVRRSENSRFYTKDGQAVYEIPKKSGKGMKAPNINDAIENGWLPSVTTILKTLAKPALQDWLIEQAVLAVLTSPRATAVETDDEFVNRILKVERVQDQQSEKAAGLGTDIHKSLENAIQGVKPDLRMSFYVDPVMAEIKKFGKMVWSEKVLVGPGYAGRSDYLGEDDRFITLVDFKSSSNPPEKAPYDEHMMQVAAYAHTLGNTADRHVQVAIIYISTKEPGRVVTHVREDWQRDYRAFKRLLNVWSYINGLPV